MSDDPVDTAQLAIDALVVEVRKLRTRNRVLAGVLALFIVLVVWVGVIANGARHTTESLKANTAADKAESDAQALIACRLRNGANAVVRDQFARYNDTFDRLIPQPHSAGAQAAIDQLRSSVPPADKTDRDCNGDGGLDGADYPTS